MYIIKVLQVSLITANVHTYDVGTWLDNGVVILSVCQGFLTYVLQGICRIHIESPHMGYDATPHMDEYSPHMGEYSPHISNNDPIYVCTSTVWYIHSGKQEEWQSIENAFWNDVWVVLLHST